MEPFEIVRRGVWLYDGSRESAVRITRGDVLFGTGDDEDPVELRDDRLVECFTLWYESPPGSEYFPAGGGQFLTLDEAMSDAERTLGLTLTWRRY